MDLFAGQLSWRVTLRLVFMVLGNVWALLYTVVNSTESCTLKSGDRQIIGFVLSHTNTVTQFK